MLNNKISGGSGLHRRIAKGHCQVGVGEKNWRERTSSYCGQSRYFIAVAHLSHRLYRKLFCSTRCLKFRGQTSAQWRSLKMPYCTKRQWNTSTEPLHLTTPTSKTKLIELRI